MHIRARRCLKKQLQSLEKMRWQQETTDIGCTWKDTRLITKRFNCRHH